MVSTFLNSRFFFTANRVKIYTNQEKTRWVSLSSCFQKIL